ncbi:MAG: hypothetical protein ACRDXX_21170 [Stackebrandtia sp.]
MEVQKLSPLLRALCITATVVVTVAFAAGTVSADDNWFPFAPMRQFSHGVDADGEIEVYRVEGVNAHDSRFLLSQGKTGMRWAEIEGQKDEMAEDPMLAKDIAEAYEERNPHKPEVIAVELIFAVYDLEDGSLTGECKETVVASWYHDEYPKPAVSTGELSPRSCSQGVVAEWD